MLRNNNAIIRGKTGTAQTISRSRSDHLLSWFGGYMELDDDLVSLVVLIEDTDSQTKSIAKVMSKKIFNYILESKQNE
jgi:cell division protein FtsI/penicillin-binding protein 2